MRYYHIMLSNRDIAFSAAYSLPKQTDGLVVCDSLTPGISPLGAWLYTQVRFGQTLARTEIYISFP